MKRLLLALLAVGGLVAGFTGCSVSSAPEAASAPLPAPLVIGYRSDPAPSGFRSTDTWCLGPATRVYVVGRYGTEGTAVVGRDPECP